MKGDKRKQKKIEELKKSKQKKAEDMPMNKEYINKLDDKGDFVYRYAPKIAKHFLDFTDPVHDNMRQIMAYLMEIDYHQNMISRHKSELSDQKVMSRDKNGRLFTLPELSMQIGVHTVGTYREVANIRDMLINHLMPKIDDKFTPEMFDDYVGKVDESLAKRGFVLFPEEFKVIDPI